MISPNREPFSLQGLEGWQQAGREVFARDRKPMYVRTYVINTLYARTQVRTLQCYGATRSTVYVRMRRAPSTF